jgi:hypothetical protein
MEKQLSSPIEIWHNTAAAVFADCEIRSAEQLRKATPASPTPPDRL